MSHAPVNGKSCKNFSIWQQEAPALDKKNLYLRITCLGLGCLVVAAGCLGTYFLYPRLEKWSFAISGGSLLIGIFIASFGVCKKNHMDSSTKQNLIRNYRDTSQNFLETDDLNGLSRALDNTTDLPIAPTSFLRNFISNTTEEKYSSIWRECGVATLSGSLEALRQTLSKMQETGFWETEYHNYNLLALAALMVNHTASQHQKDPLVDYGYEKQREILVLLHQSYARYLETLSPEIKAQLQSEALFERAELCLTQIELDGLLLNGDKDADIQKNFALITEAYVPLCPHTLYVTQESLATIDPLYNANQRMYGDWCHITALASQKFLAKKSMDILLQMGARSRYWLARICKSEIAEDYGQYRLKENGKIANLCTPINNPQFPCYRPWYDMTYNRWIKSKGQYVIYAIDTDGKQVKGTSFGFTRDGKQGQAYFSWQQGLKIKELHQVAEGWLVKIMNRPDEAAEQFYQDLGVFYHVLCQYTPFKRGSVTFSNIMIATLIMNYREQHPEIPLPDAINLLDCYALSMQCNEFVNDVFIPWSGKKFTKKN